MTPQDFIAQWGAQGGVPGPGYALNEEQGAQSHFLGLCELLDVPKPGSQDDYRFEEKASSLAAKPATPMSSCAASLPGRTKPPAKTWTLRSSNC